MAGLITWHELFTEDAEAAAGFYSELLGLEVETADMGDFQYRMLKKGEHTEAGFAPKPPEDNDVPNHWYPYVQVDDVEATLGKGKELGGEPYMGPMDVMDGMVRIGVLGDPQRATIGIMSSAGAQPSTLVNWNELHATDVDAAAQFYGGLFGWTREPFMEGYWALNAGETAAGGLMQERGGSPVAYWLAYFGVDDADTAVAKAMELGAGVIVPTESMEGVGRYAVLTDPGGAAFGVHQGTS
jgi:predicted enzyme related to lactoylglutathione lyase